MGLLPRGRVHLPLRRLRRRHRAGLQAGARVRNDRALLDPQDRGDAAAVPVSATGAGASREYTQSMATRTMNPVHDETCSVAACAEIVGQKWTALLVHDLSEGARRFTEL